MIRPLALLLLSVTPGPQTQTPAAPLVVGETFTMESRVLRETRRINVYLPAGYAESRDQRLPVLYMPDGGMAEDFPHVAGLVQVSTIYHPAALKAFRFLFKPAAQVYSPAP